VNAACTLVATTHPIGSAQFGITAAFPDALSPKVNCHQARHRYAKHRYASAAINAEEQTASSPWVSALSYSVIGI
jgi:hypothetical protein